MAARHYFMILLPIVLLAAGSITQAENPMPERAGAAASAKVLYSKVHDLRIRAKPDPAMRAFGALSEGEEVLFLGERSPSKLTAVIRGKEVTAPFYKVKAKGRVGWVFAGALSDEPVRYRMPFTEENAEQTKQAYAQFRTYIDKVSGELERVEERLDQNRLDIQGDFLYPPGREVYQEELRLNECNGDYDTLTFYEHGEIVEQSGGRGLGPARFYLGEFRPLRSGLQPGMSMDEAVLMFGTPAKRTRNIILYNSVQVIEEVDSLGPKPAESKLLLFFEDEILKGVKISHYLLC